MGAPRKLVILFLAANPQGTARLALDREARAIQEEIDRSGARQVVFETRWAITPLDVLRVLRKLRPSIVHFAGHGEARAGAPLPDTRSRRDVAVGNHEREATEGHKIQADLTLDDRPAASFATVVLDGANDCSATPAERDIQAGRMIGNEAGSLLARQAVRTPGAKAEPAKTETAKVDTTKAANAPKVPAPNTVVPGGPAPGTPTRPLAQGRPIPNLPVDVGQPARWRTPATLVGLSLALGGYLLIEDARQQDRVLQKLDVGAVTEQRVGAVMLLSAVGGYLAVSAYDWITR